MDIFRWIAAEFCPRTVTSDEFIYDHMESQSGRSLPVIYQPFDPGSRAHWGDRGAILDFVESVGTGRLLDFGPGDGWPSLLVAPFVESVTGVDASERRVRVCTENASRMGIANARFVYVPAGQPLPFPDNSFDGVMAASSIEQTPDPAATIRELYRVLRPGGRLRVFYEALGRYAGGHEREAWLWPSSERETRMILYDRHIREERTIHYGLVIRAPLSEVVDVLGVEGCEISNPDAITTDRLERLRPLIEEVATFVLTHPSCETYMRWMKDAGFSDVKPTHSGRSFALRLFDHVDQSGRPQDLAGVDALLRPAVRVVIQLEAPEHLDPCITAVK